MKQQPSLRDKQGATFVTQNASVIIDITTGQVNVQVIDADGHLMFEVPRNTEYVLSINGHPFSPLLKRV